MSKWVGRSLAVVLAVALAGCGSPERPTPLASPSVAAAPVRAVIAEGSDTIEAHILYMIPLSPTRAGTLDFTVDWTSAGNRIAVYLARGRCEFEQFIASQCNVVLSSETAGPKPKVLQVPGIAAGDFTFMVGNPGDNDESFSYQVGLTSTPGAAAAGASSDRASPQLPGRYRAASR
jgi:hypothetical protein